MILSKLQLADYITVAVYLLILLFIGYKASFGKKKKDESLFLAGKSLKWYSIGFNMWGTNVGPSMLIAFASIGYSTGIVAGNFEWYAFVFLFLLAMVFAPRYLAGKVTTMPEFMGQQYGSGTRNILAWYALIKILISWLSLGLFAGGFLVRQMFDQPHRVIAHIAEDAGRHGRKLRRQRDGRLGKQRPERGKRRQRRGRKAIRVRLRRAV